MMTKQKVVSTIPITIAPDISHCVIYRTGGTANFKWHRTIAMSLEAAINACNDTLRMGYEAQVESYPASVAVGLPTTFAPEFPGVKEWH